jgi:alkylhydroperoxidase/carboxymuconolactone decarboxylase family protein YurZ
MTHERPIVSADRVARHRSRVRAYEGFTQMQDSETGPWDSFAFDALERWDPTWSGLVETVTTNPWHGPLGRKTVELICVAVNAACTNLNAEGTRRHIKLAIGAGATRDELLMVLKMASLLSIHTCSLGAPILLEEAASAGVTSKEKSVETPVCDRMRAIEQWNVAWDGFYQIDPAWTEAFIACGAPVYTSDVLDPKVAELLSIAFDVSFTHMYAPGVRRHIKAALKLGATVDEIMDVFKLCVAQGIQACNMSLPILDEELAIHRSTIN